MRHRHDRRAQILHVLHDGLVARGFETSIYSRELAPNPKSELAAAIGARYYSAQDTSPAQLAELGLRTLPPSS